MSMRVVKDKPKVISVVAMPIATKAKDAWECAIKDRDLIDAICKYSEVLRKQNIEIFKRVDNVIATDKGYFIAYFDEDLRNMEGGIDNPTPFKGPDGRMKVNIKNERQQWSVEDLASLVAKAFVPNPKIYTKVYFRDANPENCIADNLYYVSDDWYKIIIFLKRIGIKIKKKTK